MAEKKAFQTPIYVTRPLLPCLEKLQGKLSEIWSSRWLTNHGRMHNLLEESLTKVLKSQNVSIFNNGTIALLTALKAMDLPVGSEVITTPFTFPATTHCISWNNLNPVFCDICPDTMTLDVDKLEGLITPKTSAILGVHVYGIPCHVHAIQALADKHYLKVVYDAAHAFMTEIEGSGISTFGDISMYSFHATKLFNTVEGGCLTYNDSSLKEKIYYLRNFGIKNEDEVVDVGINGKMNELQAVIGLLNLDLLDSEMKRRTLIKSVYIDNLQNVEGITVPLLPADVTDSLQYFVIKIDEKIFGLSRDEVYNRLKRHNVFTRKYFYPLCSEYLPYKNLPSSSPENLKNTNIIKKQVLCLPFYGDLGSESAYKICQLIKSIRD